MSLETDLCTQTDLVRETSEIKRLICLRDGCSNVGNQEERPPVLRTVFVGGDDRCRGLLRALASLHTKMQDWEHLDAEQSQVCRPQCHPHRLSQHDCSHKTDCAKSQPFSLPSHSFVLTFSSFAA